MKEYKVKLTLQAKEHLNSIRDYIALELLSPSTASDVLKLLKEQIKKLSYLPERNSKINEEAWRNKDIRKLIVKNYYLYYIVSKDDETVKVFAVIYGRRDQVSRLGEMDI